MRSTIPFPCRPSMQPDQTTLHPPAPQPLPAMLGPVRRIMRSSTRSLRTVSCASLSFQYGHMPSTLRRGGPCGLPPSGTSSSSGTHQPRLRASSTCSIRARPTMEACDRGATE